MLCEICRKNPATIHIQEIANGEKHIIHLCGECAKKKELLQPFIEKIDLEKLFQEMIAGAVDVPAPGNSVKTEKEEKKNSLIVCRNCNWSMDQLRKTKRFGCPDCIRVFLPVMKDDIVKMQKSLHHNGLVPPGMENPRKTEKRKSSALQNRDLLAQELSALKKNLEECIQREEYEQAAFLRDKISSIRKKLDDGSVVE